MPPYNNLCYNIIMKIALFQYSPEWENRQASRTKISRIISSDEEKLKGIDLLAFSEMTLSGFTLNKENSSLDEDDHKFFRNIARKYSSAVAYCGVQEGYNTLFFIDKEGKQVSSYRKNHLFSYAGENKAYKAGDKCEPFILETCGGNIRISPAICFDLRFPYLFWQNAAAADMYVVPAAWPQARLEQWKALLKARAIENQAYIAGINRTGEEPGPLKYAGGTMLFDPLGKCVIDAGNYEGIFAAEIDPAMPSEIRKKFPFMPERRK